MKAITFTDKAIREFAEFADKQNMNRKIHEKIVGMLDPIGVNILLHKLPHNHAQGAKVEPHLRLHILLKLQERAEPVTTSVDVSFDLFNKHKNIYK
tara:strand:- start:206 stop:493 length:288 start_codon:yes stop_codon:yes gene_type:complete